MHRSRPLSRRPAPWLRVLAVACAGLIGLLAVATHSTDAHAWLHADAVAETACASDQDHGHASHAHPDHEPSADAEHGCAVTLFAQGVLAAATHLETTRPIGHARAAHAVVPERIAPAASRHLLPPPHAPPARG